MKPVDKKAAATADGCVIFMTENSSPFSSSSTDSPLHSAKKIEEQSHETQPAPAHNIIIS